MPGVMPDLIRHPVVRPSKVCAGVLDSGLTGMTSRLLQRGLLAMTLFYSTKTTFKSP